MILQTIIFPRSLFKLKEAKRWITEHGYKLSFYGKEVDVKPTQYRFRQSTPLKKVNNGSYKTIKLENGILFVFVV